MSEVSNTLTLSGWGRMSPGECRVFRPEKRAALDAILAGNGGETLIARGLGRSYGDTSVNAGGAVLDMTRMNRMLAFDAERGVLSCEAGLSLEEIINTFLPRGYYLPVTPGTKHITVGGAIANDVHGKNHHCDGTFGKYVEELTLLTPTGEHLHCTPEENADVFWATIGGVGLTGIILTASFRLQKVESAYMKVDYHKVPNLDAALACMHQSDDLYKYSVTWLDSTARGKSLGRGVVMLGNHAKRSDLPSGIQQRPFEIPAKKKKTVPIDVPSFVMNTQSIRIMNQLFYMSHSTEQGKIIDYDTYFYPLDGILDWNRGYGKAGFAQYQATFPGDDAKGVRALLEKFANSGYGSFVTVLKRMGEADPGLLSHPFKGYTISFDIPNDGNLSPFLHSLDKILLEYGARLYLAKDIAATAETIAAMYPRLKEFQAIKKRLDPEGRLSSSLARRLGLVEGGGK